MNPIYFLIFLASYIEAQQVFVPTVTAICKKNENNIGDRMVISVTTEEPFYGLLISRNIRNNSDCYKEGSGGKVTELSLNMGASLKDPDYCGVSINHKTSEKTVQIAVRQHKTLELAEDRLFLVSCGKFGSTPPSSPLPVRMSFFSTASNNEVREVVNQRAYKLRITTTDNRSFKVRNCFSFTNNNQLQVPLFDHQGCPESKIMSRWVYDGKEAESTIYSMFRFQESRLISFQCHVLFCDNNDDGSADCSKSSECLSASSVKFYSLTQPQPLVNNTDVIASITVNVLEPGETAELSSSSGECTGTYCPVWLLWVAIILGVLFLLMLLVNLFLCTALTCTCTRTELVEKDPSIIVEDYDPYNNSSSYYNNAASRYSIEKIGRQQNYGDSDHYAVMPPPNLQSSRPSSRFSK